MSLFQWAEKLALTAPLSQCYTANSDTFDICCYFCNSRLERCGRSIGPGPVEPQAPVIICEGERSLSGELTYEEMLMVKTAWYYYIENYTQQKIAELMGISRVRVIRLLEKARQEGIVSFRIRQDNSRRMQLEKALTARYGLKDAFLIPVGGDAANLNESLAQGAAMYIGGRLTDSTFINMGYGDTPSRVLNHLARSTEYPINVVSLTGGVSYYLPNAQSSIFNARLHLIPAPFVMDTAEMADMILREESVRRIRQMSHAASMTVLGIGGMDEDATIIKNGILNNADFLLLKMQGAVGDLLSHFIDEKGCIVQSSVERRLVSTSLEELRTMDNVIGVAGGEQKVDAIRAVLTGGYLDTLITDEATAQTLLEGCEN